MPYRIAGSLWRESVSGGFSVPRANSAERWRFLCFCPAKYIIKQAVELPLTCNPSTFIWHHWNDLISSKQHKPKQKWVALLCAIVWWYGPTGYIYGNWKWVISSLKFIAQYRGIARMAISYYEYSWYTQRNHYAWVGRCSYIGSLHLPWIMKYPWVFVALYVVIYDNTK